MLGSNGGLLGAQRLPSSSVASGLWLPNEQSVARRAAAWPEVVPGVLPDPYWSNVLLLYRFSGSSIVDAGPVGNNPLTVSNVQIVSGQSPFVGSSAYFNGASSELTMPNITLAESNNFTVEFWAKPDIVAYHTVLGNTSSPYGKSRVLIDNGPSVEGRGTVAIGAWSHIALVRNSGVEAVYINGVGTTYGFEFTARTFNRIGSSVDGGSTFWRMNGYLLELRITANIARYTTDFTPLTGPFPTG